MDLFIKCAMQRPPRSLSPRADNVSNEPLVPTICYGLFACRSSLVDPHCQTEPFYLGPCFLCTAHSRPYTTQEKRRQ